MYRLFVSLSLPEVVLDALAQLQSGLKGARWLAEDQLHLTLQFIGEVDRHGLEECASALASVSAPAFELRLSGCGFYGDKRPRVLWVGAAPCPALMHLQSKIATALARAGHPGDRRKFSAHVTIARLNGVSQESAAAFAAMHGLFSCGPFPVTEFHLVRSLMGKEGSHYETLQSYRLPPSVAARATDRTIM
uniref:RNA 2',3'-cyclic phosphodiesterase n=1 Tax=uncultured bacterium UPO57 TaxID=1776980 RepID=A0A126SYJ6_9BACT|nr:2'-5' RNA ligase [uncultured bacterium UPO57]